MKRKTLLLAVCCFAMGFVMAGVRNVRALDLYDGKLVIHGKISEQMAMRTKNKRPYELYDYDIFHLRSTLKLETMWHVQECANYEINLYGVWKNFYDVAHQVDSGYHNYLKRMSGRRGVEELKSYETFTDISRELYGQYANDTWDIRLGKQIISWGETSFERMADIINPIDSRGMLNPGYPDFAEMKRGLWMGRFFLTLPDMPSNIAFELLIIPDFQPNRQWPAGHHYMHPTDFNMLKAPNEALLAGYRDAPKTWGSPEIAFRIKGFTWNTDWSLFYFYHRNDNPVSKEGTLIKIQLATLTGWWRLENVKRYAWQHSIGATFSRPIDRKISLIPGTPVSMSGNVLRGEFIAEIDRDVNALVNYNYKVVERNRYAGVLAWDTKIYIPGLTPWNRNKFLGSTTQLFCEWVPDRTSKDIMYPYYPFRKSGHHFSTITESLSYGFLQDRIMPGFYGVS